MVIDYRERKPVSKNRPKRQPAGIFFFSIFVAVIIAYTLGLVTGWLIFRSGKQQIADNQTPPAVEGGKGATTPAPTGEQAPPINNGPVKEPMLTFYETLPKGNRELIGSGLNLPRQAEPKAVKPVPPRKPENAEKEANPEGATAKPKETAKNPEKELETQKAKSPAAAKETSDKVVEGKGKFVVQVASYHEKKEAEELRDKLKSAGVPAYIVESKIADMGTFYRVRAGRHMDQNAAQEMAEKAGKGAIIIPE